MKKTFFLLSFAMIAMTITAQKVINDPNAQKRNVSGYHAISVSGGVDLYLSQGNESVAVSASDAKYRDRIKTEVKDGVLNIWYERNGDGNMNRGSNNKLKAYVSFKNLDKLTASGGSDVDVDGTMKINSLALNISGGSDFKGKIQATELKVDATGGSDASISGAVKNLKVEASGGSDFKCYELVADVCDVNASGGSDIYITANKELTADASGGSDVYYKGNATVREVKSSGSGSVKKANR